MRTCISLFLLLSISSFAYAQTFVRNGNTVTYRGNKFEIGRPENDTTDVVDPVTGQEMRHIKVHDPSPQQMNGTQIYQAWAVSSLAEMPALHDPLEIYVLKRLAPEFEQLPDGDYFIDTRNIVVDRQGKIVFYEYQGITTTASNETGTGVFDIPVATKAVVEKKIDRLFRSAYKMTPARSGDRTVLICTDQLFGDYKIVVSAHSTSIARR
jgi:hypothetical protein